MTSLLAQTAEPTLPKLTHVFDIHAEIGPVLSNGRGANGERKHIPITGGRLVGEGLSGQVLAGGSDWLWERADRVAEINAHYTVQLSDGTLIYVVNQGIRFALPGVLTRLANRNEVMPSEYYFRTSPTFDVPDGPHQWLRESLFVASVAPGKGQVLVRVYRVE
jgi:Protein of unknown function (DUF3237)